MKVVFATPTRKRPSDAYLAALEASVPALDAAGITHQCVFHVGSPYISHARSVMLRKALDAKADAVVFLDDDMGWRPDDLLRLIQTDEPVVAATYRFKMDEERYMGTMEHVGGVPLVREDGCIEAQWVPAGFLKVTAGAVDTFIKHYPQLCFGPRYSPFIDLFNHGAHENLWYGEDYAFSRNWKAIGGKIALLPDLHVDHYEGTRCYAGNYHEYLLRRPGGRLDPARVPDRSAA